MERYINTKYKDFKPKRAFTTDNWCKGIIVFNYTYPELHIICHRVNFKVVIRPDAVGAWHVKQKTN